MNDHAHSYDWITPSLQRCRHPGCRAERHIRTAYEETRSRAKLLDDFLAWILELDAKATPLNKLELIVGRAESLKGVLSGEPGGNGSFQDNGQASEVQT